MKTIMTPQTKKTTTTRKPRTPKAKVKLPPNPFMFEILELVDEARSKAKKVEVLKEYIKGGRDSNHQQLREAYGHISKPQARKIMNYLGGILEDAARYSYDRRPGRRKKDSK